MPVVGAVENRRVVDGEAVNVAVGTGVVFKKAASSTSPFR
jgi:hypothetical protein